MSWPPLLSVPTITGSVAGRTEAGLPLVNKLVMPEAVVPFIYIVKLNSVAQVPTRCTHEPVEIASLERLIVIPPDAACIATNGCKLAPTCTRARSHE